MRHVCAPSNSSDINDIFPKSSPQNDCAFFSRQGTIDETGTREVSKLLKLLEKMDLKICEMKEKFEEGMADAQDEIDGLKANLQGKELRIAGLESELSATKSRCQMEYRLLKGQCEDHNTEINFLKGNNSRLLEQITCLRKEVERYKNKELNSKERAKQKEKELKPQGRTPQKKTNGGNEFALGDMQICEKSVEDQITSYGNMIEKSVGEGVMEEVGFRNKEDSGIEKNRTEISDKITGDDAVHTNGEEKQLESQGRMQRKGTNGGDEFPLRDMQICEKSINNKTTVYGNVIGTATGKSVTEASSLHNEEDSVKKKDRTEVLEQIIDNTVESINGEFVGVSRKSVKRIYLGGVKEGVNVEKVKQYMVDKKVNPTFVRLLKSQRRGTIAVRVNVNTEDFEQVCRNEFWPNNVYAREWLSEVSWKKRKGGKRL